MLVYMTHVFEDTDKPCTDKPYLKIFQEKEPLDLIVLELNNRIIKIAYEDFISISKSFEENKHVSYGMIRRKNIPI